MQMRELPFLSHRTYYRKVDFLVLTILLIVLVNISYMSVTTLRMILVIKGYVKIASIISMFEEFIYLVGLTFVLDELNNIWYMAAYCLGWGLGVFIGSVIEKKLALGHIVFEVTIDYEDAKLITELREQGYGVTSWDASGRDGRKLCFTLIAKRKLEMAIRKQIVEKNPGAFLVSYEPHTLNGGYIRHSKL